MSGASRKGFSGLMNNPIGIMSMGLVSATLFFICYRKGLEPMLKKRDMKRSEEFAEYIYQNEIKEQKQQ